MPLCSAFLVKLRAGTTREDFLQALLSSTLKDEVKIAAHVRAPVIRATLLDNVFLNCTSWDLFLVLGPGLHALPTERHISSVIDAHYSISVGVPSRILDKYAVRSADLNAKAKPPLQSNLGEATLARDSQNLEISKDLLDFADELCQEYNGSVSMLNLLHFFDGKEQLESYHRYGEGFAKIGGRFGGSAKFVGRVVQTESNIQDSRGPTARASSDWWNEISFVHYPSIRHFCDMAASEAYQDINRKHRMQALRDTTIICCTEIDLTAARSRLKGKL